LLFAPDVTYYTLAARMNGGAQIKRTRITDEFTFEDFQEMYSESLIVLFVVTEGGQLNIATADAPLVPKAGQTVIALVDPVAEEDG
jgi:CPA1 family monovalent cation:H+ antiporter